MLHHWEEPCLAGTRGSGTVFFGGCPLGCLFCQNHAISHRAGGAPHTAQQLAARFLAMQQRGAHNLNLVTAGHYRPWVQRALALARAQGFSLPVVWNSGGYETTEALDALAADVDIWLLDLKFHAAALAATLADAPDYFPVASAAAKQACRLAGPPVFGGGGLLRRGVILRLLVLPGHHKDAMALLRFMASELPRGGFLLSLMRQYTPPPGLGLPRPLSRRLASYEYRQVLDEAERLGLATGYTQQAESASAAYIPPFEV